MFLLPENIFPLTRNLTISQKQMLLLKLSFIIGTIADFIVGINWFLISIGYKMPNLIAAYSGSGADYRFAMYIATIFMFSWTAILFWGYFNPVERRGLLLIAAVLLLISIIVEWLFFSNVLTGPGFIWGIVLRLLLIGKLSFSYLYSLKK